MNIYKITNLTNEKVYIGQTINSPECRLNQHLRDARCKKKKNYGLFHNAIENDGEDNFIVDLIEVVQDAAQANDRERFWITYYNSTNPDFGYNCDSGGTSGGVKNDETKRKIGLTTKEKWKNPETAARMMNGLKKGNETAKNNIVRLPFICPICGKVIYVEPYILKTKKYCSQRCAQKNKSWAKGVANSAKIMHERNVERKSIIKEDIIDWCNNNKEIVEDCPKNTISSSLVGLKNMLFEKYGIKDLRSIFICFGVKNLKSLLNELQNSIKSYENVRCTGLN